MDLQNYLGFSRPREAPARPSATRSPSAARPCHARSTRPPLMSLAKDRAPQPNSASGGHGNAPGTGSLGTRCGVEHINVEIPPSGDSVLYLFKFKRNGSNFRFGHLPALLRPWTRGDKRACVRRKSYRNNIRGKGKRSSVRRGALPAACSVSINNYVTMPLDALATSRTVVVQTLLGALAMCGTVTVQTLLGTCLLYTSPSPRD